MYLLLAFAYHCTVWNITPLMTFSTIIIYLNLSANSVFFRDACHANPGADKRCVGSSSYISMHLLQKLSNTSVSTVVLQILHDTFLGFVFRNLPKLFSSSAVSICNVFHCQIVVRLPMKFHWIFANYTLYSFG